MTLYGDFLKDDHRQTGKWTHYFPIYERHLQRFQNRYVTLLEIGIARGGSLQLWKRYLGPFVRIVGIDTDPRCRQVEEEQIAVRIGSQADLPFLAGVIEEFGVPDIVIDDGSHLQSHVNTSFDFLFPQLPKNGVYLVEALHTAYWPDFEGGLNRPGTFVERAKSFIDTLHAQHVKPPVPDAGIADRIASVHAYDSVVVIEVGEARLRYDKWMGGNPAWSDTWPK